MKASSWMLRDFENALQQLEAALKVPADNDVVRAGCIQYFEFTFELAWKAVKVTAQEMGLPECTSPKVCFKQAFASKWIDDEAQWLDMLDARNKMSHTYRAQDALKVYERLNGYLPALRTLLWRLRSAQEA